MRKIIDGVIYDTDKATLVVSTIISYEWDSAGAYKYVSDFHKVMLYLSDHGNWFFYSQGGYRRMFSTKWWGEGELSPATPERVYKFLVWENMIELLKKYFPEKIRDA